MESGFLIAVRTDLGAGRGAREAWHEWFVEATGRQIDTRWLGADGALIDWDDERAGTYRLVELAEARQAFGLEDWFELETRCPLVGPVVGFLHVDGLARDADLREWLLGQLLYVSRGFLVRLDDGRRIDATVEEDFTLENCNSKHGFHDGDCFYDHGGAHADYVRAAILARLRELGLQARLITFGTGHNPFRIEETDWHAFDMHKHELLRLWVFNCAVIESPWFTQMVGE